MTITKVAEMAGVGVSTVSRVINRHPAVAPATANKVRAVMSETGYVASVGRRGPKPKPVARSAKLTGTLGVVLVGRKQEFLDTPYEAQLLRGLVESAQEVGLKLNIMMMPNCTSLPPPLRRGDVDGLIIMGTDYSEKICNLFHPIPLVWIGGLAPDIQTVDHVVVRNAAVGRLAAQALVTHGCRHPAYLNHDPHHSAFSHRFNIFKETLKEAGLSPTVCLTPDRGLSDAEIWSSVRVRADMGALVDELLATQPDVDGIYVPTDQQAAVVYAALKEKGIQPGKDVITVSCNNDDPWLTTMHPRPATIDPRQLELARLAIERLRGRIEHPQDNPIAVMIAPRLVEAESQS